MGAVRVSAWALASLEKGAAAPCLFSEDRTQGAMGPSGGADLASEVHNERR